ncbi:hypothetical protein OXX59_010255, partial [Metschnikowia pulcherrima]
QWLVYVIKRIQHMNGIAYAPQQSGSSSLKHNLTNLLLRLTPSHTYSASPLALTQVNAVLFMKSVAA